MKRNWLVITAVLVCCAGSGAGAAEAWPGTHAASVAVGGTVATPTNYTLDALDALPQTTFSVTRRTWWGSHTETAEGVPVESLVNAAGPTLPNAKNAMLRVTVTVGNVFGWHVTFALGELDAAFGNHPAYLALSEDGHALRAPELVVPGDASGFRTVPFVDRITVAVQNPTPDTPSSPGSLTIVDGDHTRTVSASTLAALPADTLQVSFLAGTTSQQHTEIGPKLLAVLRASHIRADLNTWVAAVGSDGYVAVVTPAEAPIGGRPLLISLNEDGQPLAQPRLIADGDVKGGRYVSGVVDLVVGEGSLGP